MTRTPFRFPDADDPSAHPIFAGMDAPLDNPVLHALSGRDAHLGTGADGVYWFDEAVSPFAGFPSDHPDGFRTLHRLLPPGRRILYATRGHIDPPEGWALAHRIEGLQFVFRSGKEQDTNSPRLTRNSSKAIGTKPTPLGPEHAPEMVTLARLTKPGPFDLRTLEFGHYYGIFEEGRLAAMTGQRLHLPGHSEISAVCTHPDFLGRGHATRLIEQQLDLILGACETPFLHVRGDNDRAIAVYERLGFERNGVMNFYFLRKKN